MIDTKYKNMLVSSAKTILGKTEAFQRGVDEAQNGKEKDTPYFNEQDTANYENGYDTGKAAVEELEEFLKDKV